MLEAIGLLALHVISLYYLRLLWKDKNESIKRGRVLTKMGRVYKKSSPRLFQFSIWVDFVILSAMYILLMLYSVFLLMR
jgi:hypothetical protein